jgi:hypothetical protein
MCAVNSNEVKAGLEERSLARIGGMIDSVIDMGRRVYT